MNKKPSKYDQIISNVDPDLLVKWKNEQDDLKGKMTEVDDFNFVLTKEESQITSKPMLKRVAGVDISASKTDNNLAVVAVVIIDYETLNVLYEKYELVYLKHPYVPGFLAFREVEHLMKMFEDLKNFDHSLLPEIVLVDGNGIYHSNRFGLACHLGVLINIPSFGCSKTVFFVDGLNKSTVRKLCKENFKNEGDHVLLKGTSGAIWGAALKSTKDSISPMIISIGHRICLDSALIVVKNMTKYRVPEPIRLADKRSRFLIKDCESNLDKYKFDKITPISLVYNNPNELNNKDSDESD